jgi:hypothetical protein
MWDLSCPILSYTNICVLSYPNMCDLTYPIQS